MEFKIRRRYSLDGLGEEWKNCYLDFTPITIKELTEDIANLSAVDAKDTESVVAATRSTVKLLKDHFLDGKAIGIKGDQINVTTDDLEDLPAEVLMGVLSFLSQGLTKPEQNPSGMSSQVEQDTR